MNWDEMINYIKSEKIRIETENSETTTSNEKPTWYEGKQPNSGNENNQSKINS